jgi:ribosome-binding protein aMBF1 (putative translation factor)
VSEREVLRCRRCSLNQFATSNRLCRKCSEPYEKAVAAPEPVAVREAVATPRQALIPGFRFDLAVMVARTETGLSQRQLAKRMDVPRTYISKIENNKCAPNLSSIEKFASGLGLSTWQLVDLAMVERTA